MAASYRMVTRENDRDSTVSRNVSDRYMIYIAPQKIQKRRRDILLMNSSKKGLNITNELSNQVTHLVSACDSCDQVLQFLDVQKDSLHKEVQFLSTEWLSECLKAGKIVPAEKQHCLPLTRPASNTAVCQSEIRLPVYECQRPTPLCHHNNHITHALEVLAKEADFKNDEVNYSRALAFRRAACVFKSLPSCVKTLKEIEDFHSIGDHVKRVVKDILENGFSSEADKTENSEWFKTMKTFTGIFGVGPATADKWYRLGLRTVNDLKIQQTLPYKDERISTGLTFHNDLTMPVLRSEAEALMKLLKCELDAIDTDCKIILTGGFRRGKDHGHDIDFLISHPDEGKEQGILHNLLQRLDRQGLLIYGKQEQSSWNERVLQGENSKGQYLKTTLDHFEKWIGIMRLDKRYRQCCVNYNVNSKQKSQDIGHNSQNTEQQFQPNCHNNETISMKRRHPSLSEEDESMTNRSWYARRVDLIVTPVSQYYYALVGWTGSKHFNRSLRLYAQRELGMKLTSHALYHMEKKCLIPAKSEEEVFKNLKLRYLEPHERNC